MNGRKVSEGDAMGDLAGAVRRACVQAALDAHEDAGVRGLCAEGRWEAAVEAIRAVDLRPVVEDARRRT